MENCIILGINAGLELTDEKNVVIIGDNIKSLSKDQENLLFIGDKVIIGDFLMGQYCNLKNIITKYNFNKSEIQPEKKHISMFRLKSLENSIGWLSKYSTTPQEIQTYDNHIFNETFDVNKTWDENWNEHGNVEATNALNELGLLNHRRLELIDKILGFKTPAENIFNTNGDE